MCILTRDNSYNIGLSNHLNYLNYEGVNFEFILVDQFKFFRRQEIKDIIAFLKLIVNRYDSLSLKRIVSRLPTGVDITEDEIIQIAAIKINKNGEVTKSFEKFLKNKKAVASSEHLKVKN